jgi:hypothetical protein
MISPFEATRESHCDNLMDHLPGQELDRAHNSVFGNFQILKAFVDDWVSLLVLRQVCGQRRKHF